LGFYAKMIVMVEVHCAISTFLRERFFAKTAKGKGAGAEGG